MNVMSVMNVDERDERNERDERDERDWTMPGYGCKGMVVNSPRGSRGTRRARSVHGVISPSVFFYYSPSLSL